MAAKSTEDTAEKAYAEAAAKLKASETPVAKPAAKKAVAAKKPAPVATKPVAPTPVVPAKKPLAVKRPPAPKAPAPKVVAAPKPVAVPPAPKPVAAKIIADPVPVPAPVAAAPEPVSQIAPNTVIEPKEIIMATQNFTDTATDTLTGAMGELQSRAQAAYEKSTEALGEMSEFTKGNVEALVESGKIVATGVQTLGKSYVDEAKSAYETLTADLKEMAAVKSPTDLFQLQGKIMRRNFDALVAASSKNTEAAIKLANDAFAPVSARVNLATEKLSKVA